VNIVLTGSSSGIGRALAHRLVERGHQIWGLARSDQSEDARLFPSSFHATRCDLSSWEQVASAAAEVAKVWSHIDALVACAGSQGEIGRAVTADPAAWSLTVRANLDATYFSIRAFYPLLAKAPRRAKIVCFSGGGASKSRPNFTAYASAKTAIVRLVETIADEEKGSRLDINALAPGAINTRLTEEVLAKGASVVGTAEFEAAAKQKATGGGSMDKALDAVEWLVSEASDGISGRLISAPWDPFTRLKDLMPQAAGKDLYMLRRTTPEDLGLKWS